MIAGAVVTSTTAGCAEALVSSLLTLALEPPQDTAHSRLKKIAATAKSCKGLENDIDHGALVEGQRTGAGEAAGQGGKKYATRFHRDGTVEGVCGRILKTAAVLDEGTGDAGAAAHAGRLSDRELGTRLDYEPDIPACAGVAENRSGVVECNPSQNVTIQDEKLTGFPVKAVLMDSIRSSPCLRIVEM